MLEGDGEAVAFVGHVAAAGRPPWSDRRFSDTRNGPTRSPKDLSTSPTRYTDIDGPGAIPHQMLCILLWPVDGYTPTVC
jgi:hypothetical protein